MWQRTDCLPESKATARGGGGGWGGEGTDAMSAEQTVMEAGS